MIKSSFKTAYRNARADYAALCKETRFDPRRDKLTAERMMEFHQAASRKAPAQAGDDITPHDSHFRNVGHLAIKEYVIEKLRADADLELTRKERQWVSHAVGRLQDHTSPSEYRRRADALEQLEANPERWKTIRKVMTRHMEEIVRQKNEFCNRFARMEKESSGSTNISTSMFVNPATNITMVAWGTIDSQIMRLTAQP